MPRMETSITHASMPRKGCLSMLFGPILCSDSRERSSVAKVGIAVLMLEPAVGCWDYWTMTIYSPSNSICISSSSSSSPFFSGCLFAFLGTRMVNRIDRTLTERKWVQKRGQWEWKKGEGDDMKEKATKHRMRREEGGRDDVWKELMKAHLKRMSR